MCSEYYPSDDCEFDYFWLKKRAKQAGLFEEINELDSAYKKLSECIEIEAVAEYNKAVKKIWEKLIETD